MTALTLHLLDGLRHEVIESVCSLVAADASGQFGLLPEHEYFITALQPGLLRYRLEGDSQQHFIASLGGLLSCQDNQVRIVSARLLKSDDDLSLLQQLATVQQQEQQHRQGERQARVNLERNLIKRLRDWSEHQP